jgi:hypothetical protein
MFQEARRQVHSRIRARSLFDPEKQYEGFAFHWGGNAEIQMNLGLEEGGERVRVGVAFSMEMPHLGTFAEIKPRIERFNAWVEDKPSLTSNMDFCYWQPRHREDLRKAFPAGVVPAAAIKDEVFVFMGKVLPWQNVDPVRILDYLESLLPIYMLVEGTDPVPPVQPKNTKPVVLLQKAEGNRAPHPLSRSTPSRRPPEAITDPRDIHRRIEHALYQELIREFDVVRSNEVLSEYGTEVDMVVDTPDGPIFFEIKEADSLRICLREALGQILEYAHWGGAIRCSKMVIVSRHEMENEGQAYLDYLCEAYNIPIEYRRVAPVDPSKFFSLAPE